MYHPESDCLFEIDRSEFASLMQTIDGQLCNEVTGMPAFEERFKVERP